MPSRSGSRPLPVPRTITGGDGSTPRPPPSTPSTPSTPSGPMKPPGSSPCTPPAPSHAAEASDSPPGNASGITSSRSLLASPSDGAGSPSRSPPTGLAPGTLLPAPYRPWHPPEAPPPAPTRPRRRTHRMGSPNHATPVPGVGGPCPSPPIGLARPTLKSHPHQMATSVRIPTKWPPWTDRSGQAVPRQVAREGPVVLSGSERSDAGVDFRQSRESRPLVLWASPDAWKRP